MLKGFLHGGYDIHLRRLRRQLKVRQQQMLDAIEQYFPRETQITRPEGGYFLWVVLPKHINTSDLLQELLDVHNISIAPGTLFASDDRYKNCMRINCSYQWNEQTQQALKTVANCIKA